MSSNTTSLPPTPTHTFTPAQENILNYTEGLAGVNLPLNDVTSNIMYGSPGLIAIVIFLARSSQVIANRVRLLSTINAQKDQQQYWARTGSVVSWIKKNLLVAPLIHKRHNKEVQLSSAINVGTIPTRLHTIFLAFYLLNNVAFCCMLDYRNQSKAVLLAELRGRSGHLATYNMLPLILFAARNNPFVALLGISFDTFNLFHRWIGRVAVVEAIVHTFSHLDERLFLIYGLISTVAVTAILIQSVSVIRQAAYETFLHLHQALAAAAIVGLVLHCKNANLPQVPFLYALISPWVMERLIRLGRMFYRRGATVHIKALEGEACRLTFEIRGRWTKNPGTHIYAYIPSISLWMSQPFSVAWVEQSPTRNPSWSPTLNRPTSTGTLVEPPSGEVKLDFPPQPSRSKTTISCIIASRTGMTAALYRKARQSPTGSLSLSAFVEGPYGSSENMKYYGTVVLFAGGVGITHQLSILYDLVSAFADGTCATRKAVLIWSVRIKEQLEWIGAWLDDILHMSRRESELKVLLYVTRTTLGREESGAVLKEMGLSEHITFGRMNVQALVSGEFQDRVGAMSVGVCGPGGLADDVRMATRGVSGEGGGGNVEFWEESFTW
ncbi:related to metalloreductase [Phialocephala subalpina]|uniref:Related to metalloreductase n=1 Tax=Phialocephala subalpina TaxID=576137 RepID=A0A1L7WHI5_9HELO|nr:related to metalloreductase [Phialocephala subalpina]